MTRQTLLILVAVLLGGYAFGSCHAVRDSRDHILEANAYRLAKEMRPRRDSLRLAISRSDALRTAVGRAEEGVEIATYKLSTARDSSASTLSNASATNAELRRRLSAMIVLSDSLMIQVGIYRDSVNAAMQASLRERYAAQALQATQDSTILAFKTLYENSQCKILGMSCPTRKTVALVSGGSVLILVLLIL